MATKVKNAPNEEEIIDQTPPLKFNPSEQKKLADKELKDREKALKRSEKKGGSGRLIVIAVVLLLVGLAVWVVGFNGLGVRDKYVYGFLRNIPIVKNVVPAPKAEDDPLAGLTNEQLALQINGLQTQLENKDAEIKSLNDKSDSYVKELARLQEIEKYQLDVKAQKEEFDNMIALNDPSAYEKFYASVSPENAERLYKAVVGTIESDKELKNYASTFSAMDEGEAAKILEAMIASDMNRVVLILKNISVDARAAIMGKLTPANGARVARMLAPDTTPAP